MKPVIYTQELCPLCAEIKAHFGEGNYKEKDAAKLMDGTDKNMDAMAQLAMQGMVLPLVEINGKWVCPKELLANG